MPELTPEGERVYAAFQRALGRDCAQPATIYPLCNMLAEYHAVQDMSTTDLDVFIAAQVRVHRRKLEKLS